MRSVRTAQTGSEGYARWLPQALGLPAACALLALSVHLAGGDLAISALFFDPSTGEFPLRDQQLLELIGHKLAKSLVVALWCGLLAAAAASSSVAELRGNRRLLWATVVAMALGPVVVAILKELTTLLCPWNLQRFGGLSQDVDFGFTLPSRAGHCFPAGHSAGGFSLFALAFAERSRGNARAMRIGFAMALTAGIAFSLVRVVQGAHFLSHALWAASIDWLCAALVFRLFRPSSVPATLEARP